MHKLDSPIVYAEFVQPHHTDTVFRVRFRTKDGRRYITPEYSNDDYCTVMDAIGLFDPSITWSIPRWFNGNEKGE